MGVGRLHPRRRGDVHCSFRRHPHIVDPLRIQMPGLDDDGRSRLSRPPTSLLHGLLRGRRRLALAQHRELRNIRGDDGRAATKLAHGSLCVGGKEAVPAGGDHYRIDDDYQRSMLVEEGRNRVNDLSGAEHPGFDGVDSHVIADSGQLLDQEVGRRGVDGAHPFGVLGHQGGDDSHRISTCRDDRFGVGCGASFPGRIGTRN